MDPSAVPEPREPGELFQFRVECAKIFDAEDKRKTDEFVSLVASAGKFGLVFAANKTSVKVFQLHCLLQKKFESWAVIEVFGDVTTVSTSCDGTTLLITDKEKQTLYGNFFDIKAFNTQGAIASPFYRTSLSTFSGSHVRGIAWNPTDATCLAVVCSNGALDLIYLKEKSVEFKSLKDIGANAVGWSAKGKQLAVGKTDGSLALYKPDLTPVRTITAPTNQHSVVGLNWFTNTEFFVAYNDASYNASLMYLNGPKGKPPTYVDFQDVCYGNSTGNHAFSYSYFIPEWNLIFVLYSNGVDMAVIGKTEAGGNTAICDYCQWFPEEYARAAMNFINVTQETYPLGLACDFTSSATVQGKDESMKGPFPVLISLSTGGELHLFHVQNELEGANKICVLKEPLPSSPIRTAEQYGQQCIIIPPKLSSISSKPESVSTAAKSSSPLTQFKNSNITVTPANNAFSSLNKSSVVSWQPVGSGVSGMPQGSSVIAPSIPSFASSLSSSFASSAQAMNDSKTSPSMFIKTPTPQASPGLTKPVPLSLTASLTQQNTSQQIMPKTPNKPAIPAVTPSSTNNTVIAFANPALPPSPTPAKAVPLLASTPNTSSTVKKAPAISNERLNAAIKNETAKFEAMFHAHIAMNENVAYQVGSENEVCEVQQNLSCCNSQVTSLKDKTNSTSKNINLQHQILMESLTLYEDAKLQILDKSSGRNQALLHLRPLDPYSRRKLDEIRSKYQFVRQQIHDITEKLDLEWEEFNNKKKAYRKTVLTMDNVYHSLVSLHNLRVCAEKQLNQLLQQLKAYRVNALMPFLNGQSNDLTSLSRSLEGCEIAPKLESKKCLSPHKMALLQQAMTNRKSTPVRSSLTSKSLLLSSSIKPKPTLSCQDSIDRFSTGLPKPEIQASKTYALPKLTYEEASTPPATSPSKPYNPQSPHPLAALSGLVSKASTIPLDNAVSSSFKQSPQFGSGAIAAKTLFAPAMQTTAADAVQEIKSKEPLPKTDLGMTFNSSKGNLFNDPNLITSNRGIKQEPNESMGKVGADATNTELKVKDSKDEVTSAFTKVLPAQNLKETSVADHKLMFSSSSVTDNVTQQSPKLLQALAVSTQQTSPSLSSGQPAFQFKMASTAISSTTNASLIQPSSATTSGKENTSVSITKTSSMFDSSAKTNATASLFGGTAAAAASAFSILPQNTVFGAVSSSSMFTAKLNLGTTLSSSLPQPQKTEVAVTITSQSATSVTSDKEGSKASPSTSSNLFGQALFGKTVANALASTSTTSTVSVSTAALSVNVIQQVSSVSSSSDISTTVPLDELCTDTKPLPMALQLEKITDTPASSTPSLFGQTSSATSISSFGLSNQTTTVASLSGQTTKSDSSSAPLTGGSIFGHNLCSGITIGQTSNTAAVGSLFGQPQTSTTQQNKTTTQLFGQNFQQNTMTSSIFGQNTAATTTPSLFGNNKKGTAGSIFGQQSATTATSTTAASLFGQTVKTTASLLFEQSGQTFTTTTALPLFAQSSTPPVFGQSAQTTGTNTAASSVFGQSSSATPSIFGGATSQPSAASSSFGTTTFTQPNAQSLFGQPTTPITSFGQPIVSSSIFGQTSNTSSIFGQPTSTSVTFGQSSLFGQNSASSPFGQPVVTTSSIFGQPVSTNSASIFGQQQPATSQQSSSFFGKPATTSASLFGQPSSASSIFGPQQSSSTSSVFGQATMTASMFGNASPAAASAGNAVFGQPLSTGGSSSVFGGATNQQSPKPSPFAGVGNMFSGLGSQPSQEAATKNVFGNTFGGGSTASPQTNLFGGGGATSNPNSPFGANPGTTQSAFATPSKMTFGGGATFGGAPTFGGSPSFGASPAFGGAPKIGGSSPTFGGGNSFGTGGAASGGTFGAVADPSGSSIFGSTFSSGGGATFGGLAGASQGKTTFGGGSSFTNWR